MAAKDECERLLSATMPFAEHMLREHGEFLPFGATMTRNGDIAATTLGIEDGAASAPAMVDILRRVYQAEAAQQEWRATALVYDARVTLPDSGQSSDAIAVDLDHQDDYAVTVYYPYHTRQGAPAIGEPFARSRESLFRTPPA